MELPELGFDATPDDIESELILFWQTAGKVNSISYKVRPTREAAIADNKAYFTSIGFKEVGALKDDLLIQVAKGALKSNYGNSRKRECNFTLINSKGTTTANNITSTIAADGLWADLIVMDKANFFVHELRVMKIETGVKIQGSKLTEMNYKTGGDSFQIPLKTVKILGTSGEIISVGDTQL